MREPIATTVYPCTAAGCAIPMVFVVGSGWAHVGGRPMTRCRDCSALFNIGLAGDQIPRHCPVCGSVRLRKDHDGAPDRTR